MIGRITVISGWDTMMRPVWIGERCICLSNCLDWRWLGRDFKVSIDL